ncbi:Inactivated superfamily I helicase [Candidatus Ornithobacterium hominis]|uniref:PD-(D/E)XK nuclease family protein n=1 Tax=Candidatus Ornithobacterium hominis TaxID=2497989 RepID=UPI0024BC50D4|nr:PD-(D/E)XK nuclease family protein [Candidatus Ornithobacterium hominis]CAI9428842.1 Inactivated superfamily I helicase [Candidatus Ornithobacterium hominis]
MKSFISNCTKEILKNHSSLEKISIVVPGNRSKQFFRSAILSQNYTGVMPQFFSIEELLSAMADLVKIKGVPLWFEAYSVYKNIAEEAESFEDFIKWIPTLLKDFDDIENESVDAKTLFQALASDERMKIWSQEIEIGQNQIMQNYLGFWSMAEKFFKALKIYLENKGLGFRGMIARQAVENAEKYIENNGDFYYFCGFNALTKTEKLLIQKLIETERAACLWDADEYYLNDPIQEAGFFLRQHQKSLASFQFVSHHFSEPKDFQVIQAPDQVSQAKIAGEILSKLKPEQVAKTALILADEQLLPAVLNSLPPNIEKVNVTMGIALQNLPMSNFFRSVIELHMNRDKFGGAFYYQNLFSVLKQNLFSEFYQDEFLKINLEVQQKNKAFFQPSELNFTKLAGIFKGLKNPKELVRELQKFILEIKGFKNFTTFEKECLYHFESIFIQLETLMHRNFELENFTTFYWLYKQILAAESLSFIGEPQQGLQILGMLETRLLDFEQVIMTSVNEGTLPLGRQENTFIPFEFRKRSQLNTFLENDAIYAYHFYHVIQRCQRADFIYNSNTESLGKGEKSRFLRQLELESPHQIQQVMLAPEKIKPTEIFQGFKKTQLILNEIESWKKRISPSSLAAYVKNPIDFYQRYLLKIRDSDELEEHAGFITLGNIVHECLEELYRPYLNEILTPQLYQKIKKYLPEVLHQKMIDHLLFDNALRGKNIIIKSVIEEMLKNAIHKDEKSMQGQELILKGLEEKCSATYLFQDLQVTFHGVIDRIDSYNGVHRLIDYKTGGFSASNVKIKSGKIEDLQINADYAKAVQLIIYAYMFLSKNKTEKVMSGIFPLKHLSQDLTFLQYEQEYLFGIEEIEPLMAQVASIILEIQDPSIDFEEKI